MRVQYLKTRSKPKKISREFENKEPTARKRLGDLRTRRKLLDRD